MARPENSQARDNWWKQRIDAAPTLKGRLHVLQSKVLADLDRLPEECQEEVRSMVAEATANLLDEIEIRRAEIAWSA